MSDEFYQTDIGLIPIGWEPYRVGELVSFSGGSQPDKGVFKFRPAEGYIRLIQIRDYKTDKYETYIPTNLARKFCDKNDVMIGRYGPPIFQILRGIEGAYNVALIKATPSGNLDKDFFYHFIKNENLFSLMDALSRRSSGQTGVELPALKEYPLPLPRKKEQTAIANALSDVDALITSIKKLIVKKRAIKTAAMQQLLTGKKRLPPFDQAHTGYKQTELGEIPEDWEVRAIGEALSIRHGRDQKQVELQDGAYPILGTGGEMGRTDTFIYDKPSVLIGRKGTINKPVYMDSPFWTVDTLFYSEVSEKFSAKFIYYKFCMVDWMAYNEASGVPSLNASTIERVLQSFPKDRDEQVAIAGVLSDMDKEIDTLGQRLNKTQQLKQGMMQELLTGRTRLV